MVGDLSKTAAVEHMLLPSLEKILSSAGVQYICGGCGGAG